MKKPLLVLATALASGNAFNIVDAFTEGSCYVYSTMYAVVSTKSESQTVVSTASSTIKASSSHSIYSSSSFLSSSELSSSTISDSSSSIDDDSSSSSPEATSAANCPLDSPYSCTNTTSMDDDLCCFEYPGGVVLQTQFWDYNPATGPNDSFTIHGLWPDHCDGTYSQYCDTSMEITDAESIIASYDTELLEYMEEYWKDYTGDDKSLWLHEFNKHGTCYSTLKSSCYDNMTEYENVYEYYKKTVELFKGLPTYDWLATAGIVPSETATYAKADILAALTNAFGATPYIACDSSNAIEQVWYMYHIRGPLITGDYLPIDTLTTPGCSDDILFLPKNMSTTPSVVSDATTTTSSSSTATSSTTKGYIYLSDESGCLIKSGKWYASGTCATYSMIELTTGSVYLKSSAGYCTISDNVFTCSSDVTTPFEFNFDSSSLAISANGQTTYSANEVASGQTQEVVSLGSGNVEFELLFTVLSS